MGRKCAKKCKSNIFCKISIIYENSTFHEKYIFCNFSELYAPPRPDPYRSNGFLVLLEPPNRKMRNCAKIILRVHLFPFYENLSARKKINVKNEMMIGANLTLHETVKTKPKFVFRTPQKLRKWNLAENHEIRGIQHFSVKSVFLWKMSTFCEILHFSDFEAPKGPRNSYSYRWLGEVGRTGAKRWKK